VPYVSRVSPKPLLRLFLDWSICMQGDLFPRIHFPALPRFERRTCPCFN